MANSVDPDQTAPLRSNLVCTICICHFIRHFGVQNFKTFTVTAFYLHIKFYYISYHFFFFFFLDKKIPFGILYAVMLRK